MSTKAVIDRSEFEDVKLDRIVPDPEQPRQTFDEDDLIALGTSILEKGLDYWLRVYPGTGKLEDKFVLIAGERRWRAAQKVGIEVITVRVHRGEVTANIIAEEQIRDDIHRVQLKAMERARHFAKLMRLKRCSAEELAKELRIKKSRVERSLSLLNLDDDLQPLVGTDKLPAGVAYELAKIDDAETRTAAANRLIEESGTLTFRAATALIQRAIRDRSPGSGKTKRIPGTVTPISVARGQKVIINSRKKLDERGNSKLCLPHFFNVLKMSSRLRMLKTLLSSHRLIWENCL